MSISESSARPSTVTAAFIIWLVTVLLGIVNGIILLVLSGSAEIAGAGMTSAGVGTGVYVAAAIVAIVISLIQLLIVFQMRAGRNWARIVLTVLAVLQFFGAVSGGGNGFTGWIGVAAAVFATILMFLPASNAYFGRRR
ncbi:hypothetical protein GCM10009847_05470 [Leucobacter tardus]|uniref:Uncharacterized protein n=1 Tax=Leucobacter tardus TaxID=501483 RepID=A0A939TJ17_9MICO|nr:hypothetical protein [Leucobacter tardus]MBO2988751.1 hypothetical protein [Leucobacter tardus]